ncbi:MAG: hydantoinase B/oxoprolinase family protein [Myxococcota bacterium]
MQSGGGLARPENFAGKGSVLSGPAGGVVATAFLADKRDLGPVIGFDMGGTSTDVSRYDGRFERRFERAVAGAVIRAPMLDIHTVAAGGGSICRFDGAALQVGPESAGANPGPLCYGRADAKELTLTDIHLELGRLVDDRFPLALQRGPVQTALDAMATAGGGIDRLAVAEGFFEVALTTMGEAIRRVSVAQGHDVREHSLVIYGGAAGQVACSLAARLGVRKILAHPYAGVMSAFGIGVARESVFREHDLAGVPLTPDALKEARHAIKRLTEEAMSALGRADAEAVEELGLRYTGTETTLTVPLGDLAGVRAAFEARYERLFGYLRPDAGLELWLARVEARSPGELPTPVVHEGGDGSILRRHRLRIEGTDHDVPVFLRESLELEHRRPGPALVIDDTGTYVIEPGFSFWVDNTAVLHIAADEASARRRREGEIDPGLLEVFHRRFAAIAEQMGAAVQRTAVSTNIRDRRDYSCAVFDGDGRLVANAPHIPVHLGSMGAAVRAVIAKHPEMEPGDAFATNDPTQGGSHLPDITVVAPVDLEDQRFFVACRGHHADVGGVTAGSMPAESRSLAEEGIVLSGLRVVHQGTFERGTLREAFLRGPHPARRPDENLADLEAQIAAARLGAERLGALAEQFSPRLVADAMGRLRAYAGSLVRDRIGALPPGELRYQDFLDDGSPISVAITIDGKLATFDFSGSSPPSAGNSNAPRAVVGAAILYVLRCLVGRAMPLNEGCLDAVSIVIPSPSLLDPPPAAAVSAGNVETSQRIVDVLLGALGCCAASQGTMNNVTFGDRRMVYYETIAGGVGADPRHDGASGVHSHMTNSRITDPEVLESRFPVRVLEFGLRRGSGGRGRFRGGDGIVRELRFDAPMTVSIVSERRVHAPYGLDGGEDGAVGRNLLNGNPLPGRVRVTVKPGDRLRIETPGGGGYGAPGARSE